MSEPERQIEVQLGHLCNNRCVFCVSGQLSEQDRAPQLASEPIAEQIRTARAGGATKITFLGGEPTIQRSFDDMLELAVELDFAEIVIFTNGVMTPRDSFRERVFGILDRLGPRSRERVIWRFSLQGGDRDSHDATTCNPGAWDRIIDSMGILHDQGARLSGNMCVVSGNHGSVAQLADVAARFGLENLHLDMFRPRDSGDRTDEYLRGLMQVPYREMTASFRALAHAAEHELGRDFDLNFGNVPYCVAPDIASRVHHDGQFTLTVAASGQGTTQQGFDKYRDKRSDKHKLASCASCVFNARCGGVFDLYAEVHGHDEFAPVSADQLWEIDTLGDHFVLLAEAAVRTWQGGANGRTVGRIDELRGEIDVSVAVAGDTTPWRIVLSRKGMRSEREGWSTIVADRFEAVLMGPKPAGDTAERTLRDALAELAAALQCSAPSLDAARLAADWEMQRAHNDRDKQRLQLVRRRAGAMVERLRGARIAGLREQGVAVSEGGGAIDVRFGDGDSELVVSLDLRPAAPAQRPTLRHAATGVDDTTLAAFSRGLGAHLRAVAPATRRPL